MGNDSTSRGLRVLLGDEIVDSALYDYFRSQRSDTSSEQIQISLVRWQEMSLRTDVKLLPRQFQWIEHPVTEFTLTSLVLSEAEKYLSGISGFQRYGTPGEIV